MWIRTTRITLLVALLLAIAVLAYLAAHPDLYAPHLGRVITRNLLRDTGVTFAFEDLRGNPFGSVDLIGVSITRRDDSGGFAYVTCDSVEVSYDLGRLLRGDVHLRRTIVHHPQLLLRRGAPPPEDTRTEAEKDLMGEVSFSVGHAELRDASVVITAPDGRQQEEISNIDWVGTVQGYAGFVEMETDILHGDWPSRNLRLHRASGYLTLHERDLEITTFSARLDTTSVTLRGRFHFGEELSADLQGDCNPLVLSEVFRILEKDPPPHLVHQGPGEVHVVGDDVEIRGHGIGRIEHFDYSVDAFHASVDSVGMTFHEFEGGMFDAHASASGRMDFRTNVLDLRGRTTDFNLSRPWSGHGRPWPESMLDANFRLRLDVSQKDDPIVEIGVRDGTGIVMELPVDSLAVDLRYAKGEGVNIGSSQVNVLGTHVEGSGVVDVHDQLEMAVQLRSDDITPWLQRIGVNATGGGALGAGRLYGPLGSVHAHVGGTVALVEGYGFQLKQNQLVVRRENIFDEWRQAEGHVITSELRARGHLLGSLESDVQKLDNRVDFQRMVIALGDSTLTATGAVVARPDSSVLVELDAFEVVMGEQQWRLRKPTQATLLTQGFATPGFDIVSNTGSIHLDGSVDLEDQADFRITMKDGDLGLLARLGLAPDDLHGRVAAAIEFDGRSDDPSGRVQMVLQNAGVLDRNVDNVELELIIDGRHVEVEELSAASPEGGLDLSGQIHMQQPSWLAELGKDPQAWRRLVGGATVDLTASAANVGIDAWLAPTAPSKGYGRAGARLAIKGTGRAPRIEGRASLDALLLGPVTVPRLEADVLADSTGVQLTAGSMLAPDPWLSLRGRMPVHVTAIDVPVWNDEEGMDVELYSDGEVGLHPLLGMMPFFTRLDGQGEIRLRAVGGRDDPELIGGLKVHDGVVQLDQTLEVFRDVSLDAEFSGNQLLVRELTGREGENGRVTAHGEVTFAGLTPDDVWLDASAQRVLLLTVPYLRAIATSDDLKLRLARPLPDGPRVPKFTGSLLVDKAIYNGTFAEDADEPAALQPTVIPPWLAELRIRAQDQVRISNDQLELRLQGDMDFIRDLSGPRYRGQVEIPQGRVRVLYQDFEITQGRLDFSQSARFEPAVNITAETEVPVYDRTSPGRDLERVTVVMTGTLAEPTLTFSSESGYDEDAILRLLVGLAPTDEASSLAIGDIGYRVGVNYLGQALASQVKGVDTIDIQTQEAGLEEVGSTRIAVGKYIAHNLYLRFSQGFSITERDLFLEYQMTRRLLFNTEVRRRLRENVTQTEFNLDLKFRVEY